MLTICLIVKNEGLNIESCLASFDSLADQFLVVDTGSTDDTKLRAEAKGAKVVDFEWVDDFSAARNFALDQVKKGWVMMTDADHRISSEDSERLKLYLSEQAKELDLIELQCEFDGSYAYLPKIWRSDLGLRYKYPVHEYLELSPGLRRAKLDVIIQDPLLRDHVGSRKRYVETMEAYVKKHPKDLRMLYYLVSDNRFLKRFKKVMEWGQQYLTSEPKNDTQIARVLIHMGYSLGKLKLFSEAEKAYILASQLDSASIDSYLYLGDLKFTLSDFEEAESAYRKAEACSFEGFQSHYLKPEKYGFLPKKKLALTFLKLGKTKEAVEYAKKALTLKGGDKELQTLIQSYDS